MFRLSHAIFLYKFLNVKSYSYEHRSLTTISRKTRSDIVAVFLQRAMRTLTSLTRKHDGCFGREPFQRYINSLYMSNGCKAIPLLPPGTFPCIQN